MDSIEKLSIDTARILSADAVEQANSGHPGMPLALAPLAFILFSEVMKHDPTAPDWADRDRFVLSPGHGSMLLYSALHLSGYDLPLDELKNFRQWGSRTPGHPEFDRNHPTPGVETTTGPLGQGFANGVGMAIAERWLRGHFGSEVQDHRVWGIVSDGDLMEGIAAEAASLAGHLGLGRLIYCWDDNSISLDGPTSMSFDGEDVMGRFRSYGWQTLEVPSVDDLDAVRAALAEAAADESRPTLIRVPSVIGWPAPNKQNTAGVHGAPLGGEELAAVKQLLGFDPEQSFAVPDGVTERWSAVERGTAARAEWQQRFDQFIAADERAELWQAAWQGKALPGLAEALPVWTDGAVATRAAGGKAMAAVADHLPTMLGGSADLASSVKATVPGGGDLTRESDGRNIHFGVREHAMGAIVNGMSLHGGIVRPFGSTFLQFADYMRSAIRLSALMQLPVTWVFSHDSIALGEDGPTHQPVEHIATLRAIPELVVIRPSDANETAEAWRVISEELDGPAALILSRQDLPVLERGPENAVSRLAEGGYVLACDGNPKAVIVATGSEVSVALEARAQLAAEGTEARVVALPSWELFERRSEAQRDAVLPKSLPTVSVEAGISMGWQRYAQAHVAVDRFGASAPGDELMRRFGITPEAVAEQVRQLLGS